ncbi:MAG: OmpA family protein, partial [Candidatus Kapabacteria bacterium]|nr:OmpA family protein [Candidatus Kapabacteria bacterium]
PRPQSPPPVWLTVPDSVFVFVFYSKSTALLPESERNFSALLQQIKQQLGSKPGLQVTVEGHSSNEGSRIENLRLAVNRASSIAAQIRLKAGLQDTAVKWNAYGTLRPAFNELIPSERMKNRRVEVLIRW